MAVHELRKYGKLAAEDIRFGMHLCSDGPVSLAPYSRSASILSLLRRTVHLACTSSCCDGLLSLLYSRSASIKACVLTVDSVRFDMHIIML